MKTVLNLKLWLVVCSYAAGIVVGAKLGGMAFFRNTERLANGAGAVVVWGLLGVLFVVVLIVGASGAVYWFGAKRDPRAISAYLLIVFVFSVVGATSGMRVDFAKAANTPWVANGGGTGAAAAPSVATGSTSRGGGFSAINMTRAYVRRVMEERLLKDEAGLMMGVLLGDTSTVPADVKVDFQTTGLSHILAVSGLNITILVTACAFLFTALLVGFDTPGRVTPGRFLIFGITAGVIVFYMALCGFAPSIVRAGVMGLTALAAPMAGRQTNAFSAMAAAAMALLIIDPATVFDIGFQLSFAATVSIMLFVPHVTRWISGTPDAPSGVSKALAVTISAQFGVAPILAANFGSLSLITPAANAAVAPAIAPAQLLGIVIPMLNVIWEPLAAIAAYPAHISLAYTMAGASFFAKWPLASISIPGIMGGSQSSGISTPTSSTVAITGAIITAIYFLLLTALYIYLKNHEPRTKFTQVFRGRTLARTMQIAAVVGIVIIALLSYQTINAQPPKGLRVTFLDVGQGDSTLIQTEDGATILIDGGPEAGSAEAKLRAYGVQKISLLIITHPHADHVNGLPAVARDYPIEQAIIPSAPSKNTQYLRTMELLTNNKVKETVAREGQFYRVGKNLTVKILSPDAPTETANTATAEAGSEQASEDANNQAVVALIQYKSVKMLFTGDIELDTEEDIIADGEAQKIDILKVPHHGSKNGAEIALMEILKPRFAIISVGANNRYHHPAPTTLALLRKVGAAVFRTDKNGSVTIESDGKTITALAQR